ncbi:MAG: FliH/SctL family protein [Ghiorsea sp.]
MKLLPLPTTKILSQQPSGASGFPYPKMNAGISLDKQRKTPVLAPLLGGQESNDTAKQSGNAESQRMNELENMLSEAQSRTAVIEQEAYDKAYAAGEKSGLALGEKRAEQTVEAMETVLLHAEEELKQLQQQSIEAVVDIAQAVITHVMGDDDDNLEQMLEKSVKQALNQFVVGNQGLTLSVNPQELKMFTRMTTLPPESRIRAHQDVQAGTCRLVSVDQDILIDPKQTIDDALKHIRESLVNHG